MTINVLARWGYDMLDLVSGVFQSLNTMLMALRCPCDFTTYCSECRWWLRVITRLYWAYNGHRLQILIIISQWISSRRCPRSYDESKMCYPASVLPHTKRPHGQAYTRWSSAMGSFSPPCYFWPLYSLLQRPRGSSVLPFRIPTFRGSPNRENAMTMDSRYIKTFFLWICQFFSRSVNL